MSLNMKVKPKIHNRFDIWKENVETGVKEQVGYAENIILDAMWSRLCGGEAYFEVIQYGTGEGILSPGRTSLFSYLGRITASTVETVRAIPTSYKRMSIMIGLTTANGNTLTEVGISSNYPSYQLVTHAQIRDMNGNPTGIVKTDVDIITIYATVYITLVNDHPSIKLIHPSYNGLLSYLLGGSFPSAVFSAGMSDIAPNWPAGLGSYTIGSSATGSWSADTANKKRKTSTMRFDTGIANGHIKELLFSNIARLVLPAAEIYSGLELSDVPIGTGDGVTSTFDLPSGYIDQDSIVAKVDGVSSATTKTDTRIIYKIPAVKGGYPTGTGNGVAFSPDGSTMVVAHSQGTNITMYKYIEGSWTKMANPIGGLPAGYGLGVAFSPDGTMAVGHESSPYLTMYKDIEGVWTKMPDVTGGYPPYGVNGVAFSPDGTIIAAAHAGSPIITMYKDIEGVWTKMPDVTGGYPPSVGWGVAFSPDGTIMAVAHAGSPYITMYKDIEGVWTKMPDVTGGNPSYIGKGVAFSPDGSTMAVVHQGSPYLTMYKDIEGVWTKIAAPTGGNPSNDGNGVAFSPDGSTMVVAHKSSPNITMYKYIEGSWTKLANPLGGLPQDGGKNVAFSPDDSTMAVGHFLGNYLVMYANSPILTRITFTAPPANGAVITADYTVNGIHKTDQRVIDVSGEVQFGEPT